MTNTLGMTMRDATVHEIARTDEQTIDTLQAGFAYTPHDEIVLVDDDGQITVRESASPQHPDEVAWRLCPHC